MTAPRSRIVHVVHRFDVGGMENGVVNLINHLPADLGPHCVIAITEVSPRFAGRVSRPDTEFHSLHKPPGQTAIVLPRLWSLLRELRPAIVHTRNVATLEAQTAAWAARVPVRLHGEHGWDVGDLDGSNRRMMWLRRVLSPLVHHQVALSRATERYLIDRVGIASRKVTNICNGVDTERFAPGSPSPELGLPADFLRPDVVRIGTVGRLQPVKNQVALLEAVALLRARCPELAVRIRLVLVGDGPLREELTRQARTMMLETTTWFAGATERVPEWMRALDVFVLPSLNEGISNTLLEAMATGVPVLASAVGGNPELIEEGVAGDTFAPRDVEGLAALIERYVAEPGLRRAHGMAVRRRAESNFSLRSMVAAYGDLYRRFAAPAAA